jgi:trans-aconitate 2-methyltransferase
MSVSWDPGIYLRHADDRGRPFHDLLARVGASEPATVVDLGCGPGGLTRVLADRWPAAYVLGVDSSAQMIERAVERAVPGRLEFVLGDVQEWAPEAPLDVIFSNATLQWVPGHADLMTRWVESLAPGGWLAVQMPSNFDAPSHALMRELAESPRWRDQLAGRLRHGDAVEEPATYLDALAGAGCAVDVWQTTYLHVLPGDDAVLDWVTGTGLRPVLDALSPAGAAEFVETYRRELRVAYPRQAYGTVFPFRRTFVVAQRQSAG